MSLFTQSTPPRDRGGIVLQPRVKKNKWGVWYSLDPGRISEREGSDGRSVFEALEVLQEFYAAEEVTDRYRNSGESILRYASTKEEEVN